MIAIIRIRGQVKLRNDLKSTFDRLNLPRKFSCIFIDEKDVIKMGMLEKIKQYVIYGTVTEEVMKKVMEAREHITKDGKKKGFCRLHPPRGGFKKSTKLAIPNGVLGKDKNIDKLLEKML